MSPLVGVVVVVVAVAVAVVVVAVSAAVESASSPWPNKPPSALADIELPRACQCLFPLDKPCIGSDCGHVL
eukprot:scaffold76416_cov50-Attheya_sp.AAC.2